MEFRGRIAAGPTLAALGARRDGSTAPTAARPDGTAGNPPGTEVSRGVDEALGTNVSGAHPENERRR